MFFREKKVLVTGGTGLIGSHLILRLLAEGAIIRATLHEKPPIISDHNISYIWGDLTNPEYCRSAVDGIQYVFHCAANTSGAQTIATTPMVHVTPNVIANSLLLEASYNANIEKFLWLSSTTGYPPTENHPVKEEEMFDGEPFENYFFVGWMKRFTEILCRMYGEKLNPKMTTIVLRPTNVYGEHDDFKFETSHVLPALIRKVVERWDPVEVWGTGEDLKDLVYVGDMVDAMMAGMERVDSYESINIGYGQVVSIKQMLHEILAIDGYADADVVFNTSKPSMIPVRMVDTSKAKTLLGFKAKTHLTEGLKKTIDWYRESINSPR